MGTGNAQLAHWAQREGQSTHPDKEVVGEALDDHSISGVLPNLVRSSHSGSWTVEKRGVSGASAHGVIRAYRSTGARRGEDSRALISASSGRFWSLREGEVTQMFEDE